VQRTYGPLGINQQDGDGQPGENALMQISSPVAGGSSGGAVYNDSGAQIGVVVRRSGQDADFAFAVPLSDLKKFLARNKVETLCK
jgi:S1-C subfamily serine protease